MNVYVQNQYLEQVKQSVLSLGVGLSDNLENAADLAVFDLRHMPNTDQLSHFKDKVLIVDQEQVDFQTLKQINPRLIVKASHLNELTAFIQSVMT